MLNIVTIGQSVAKMLTFFDFSRCPPQTWIFEFAKFYLQTISGGHRRIIVPNFVKIGRSVAEILRFFEFSIWPLPSFKQMHFLSFVVHLVVQKHYLGEVGK